jgi:DNA-binding MarR family transcriptional regulator
MLGRAADRAQAMGEEDLAPLGITTREYGVLAVLAEWSPLTQTRIAAILGFDRTTILKLRAALERKGLVERARDEHDR